MLQRAARQQLLQSFAKLAPAICLPDVCAAHALPQPSTQAVTIKVCLDAHALTLSMNPPNNALMLLLKQGNDSIFNA